jgi:mono/diheme cytochrome c family protein
MSSRPGTPWRSTTPARRRAGWAASCCWLRLWLLPLLLLSLAPGCSEQDMVIQPKFKPYQESAFFADGQSSRPLVAGTVARGQLNVDDAYYRGKLGDLLVDKIPARVNIDRALLERGRERYNIYCTPCHSRSGDGRGMIVQRGFPPPPSFHERRLLDAPAGHYFNVISNGYGAMYSYASRIPVDDRWAIVAYIRALQLSQHATLDDVPADHRLELEKATETGGAKR